MFSDSHCHLLHISQKHPHFPLVLKALEDETYRFIMDIGTEPGDLQSRFEAIGTAWGKGGYIPGYIHFAVGLWPSKNAIEYQDTLLPLLEADVQTLIKKRQPYAAVGECGIDRYWNGSRVGTRGSADLIGEENLFIRQLQLAKTYNLAVIVHSRNAFEATLRCIDTADWHKGVIHCFSYGETEATAFLERGWYLSFPGTITYSMDKKAAYETAELLRMVPAGKLLLETDAPYLTPEPFRREVNTPLHIPLTYQYAAQHLHCTVQELCDRVYHNCRTVFAVENLIR